MGEQNTQKTPLFPPLDTHTPSIFFSNKSLLSFPPKPSTLVLYQYLHARVLPTPCYLPCLQVYNLEVLCLPLLLSGVSSSCPELFTLTRKKGVNKLKLLHRDKLLSVFLFHTLDVFCVLSYRDSSGLTSQSIPPGGKIREMDNGNDLHKHGSSSVRTCNTSPNLFLLRILQEREKLKCMCLK